MATQSYIAAKEEAILAAVQAAVDAEETWNAELPTNGDKPCPENREMWGTLYVNALVLRSKLNRLLEAMDKEFDA